MLGSRSIAFRVRSPISASRSRSGGFRAATTCCRTESSSSGKRSAGSTAPLFTAPSGPSSGNCETPHARRISLSKAQTSMQVAFLRAPLSGLYLPSSDRAFPFSGRVMRSSRPTGSGCSRTGRPDSNRFAIGRRTPSVSATQLGPSARRCWRPCRASRPAAHAHFWIDSGLLPLWWRPTRTPGRRCRESARFKPNV